MNMRLVLLDDRLWFPSPATAPRDGPLAVGGDLSPARLLLAYRHGIFPWYDERTPILWHSPDPRFVIRQESWHEPARLQRTIRAMTGQDGPLRVTMDAAFDRVIAACAAAPRRGQDGTWITPALRDAFIELHALGHAHSVEVWRGEELVGGVYGLAVGRAFSGESMFHTERDAGKIALVMLARALWARGFALMDCQQATPTLAQFGGRRVLRRMFLAWLAEAQQPPAPEVGKWCLSHGGQ